MTTPSRQTTTPFQPNAVPSPPLPPPTNTVDRHPGAPEGRALPLRPSYHTWRTALLHHLSRPQALRALAEALSCAPERHVVESARRHRAVAKALGGGRRSEFNGASGNGSGRGGEGAGIASVGDTEEDLRARPSQCYSALRRRHTRAPRPYLGNAHLRALPRVQHFRG